MRPTAPRGAAGGTRDRIKRPGRLGSAAFQPSVPKPAGAFGGSGPLYAVLGMRKGNEYPALVYRTASANPPKQDVRATGREAKRARRLRGGAPVLAAAKRRAGGFESPSLRRFSKAVAKKAVIIN